MLLNNWETGFIVLKLCSTYKPDVHQNRLGKTELGIEEKKSIFYKDSKQTRVWPRWLLRLRRAACRRLLLELRTLGWGGCTTRFWKEPRNSSVQVRFPITVMKHRDFKQVGMKFILLPRYRLSVKGGRTGTQRWQTLEGRSWRRARGGVLLRVCSVCFLTGLRTTISGMALRNQPLVNTNVLLVYQSYGGIFSIETPFTPMTPACLKVT